MGWIHHPSPYWGHNWEPSMRRIHHPSPYWGSMGRIHHPSPHWGSMGRIHHPSPHWGHILRTIYGMDTPPITLLGAHIKNHLWDGYTTHHLTGGTIESWLWDGHTTHLLIGAHTVTWLWDRKVIHLLIGGTCWDLTIGLTHIETQPCMPWDGHTHVTYHLSLYWGHMLRSNYACHVMDTPMWHTTYHITGGT